MKGGAASAPPPGPPPQRIVCLVPSLTESLFALGLGGKVVGVTDYCVHPAQQLAEMPRVGGTKTPDLDVVVGLAPDLVIANREENRRRDVERLQAAGVPVWVTYPRTVREGAELLGALAALGASPEAVSRVVEPVRRAVDAAETARSDAGPRVFCPIWRGPWMAVGGDTYAHDLITLCGGRNVFGAAADRRYPRVREEEIVAGAPELILLPDEPYAFGPQDAAELRAWPVPAARSGRIHLIDGTLVSWYGARISRAIATLRSLFEGG